MKKLVISVFFVFFITEITFSQADNTDIDIVQSLYGRSKRLIIDEYMQLNEAEKNAFWRMYDQYEEKRKSIERDGFILLKEYADNYHNMSGEEARKLIVKLMKTADGYNTLHKVYFRKMEKVVGSLKAATFIQLETFIQTTLLQNLQNQVPVIGELDRQNRQNTQLMIDTQRQ